VSQQVFEGDDSFTLRRELGDDIGDRAIQVQATPLDFAENSDCRERLAAREPRKQEYRIERLSVRRLTEGEVGERRAIEANRDRDPKMLILPPALFNDCSCPRKALGDFFRSE
jgi:hypothetical protein